MRAGRELDSGKLDVVGWGSADGGPKAMVRKLRANEWTPEDQASFLAHLAATANVRMSARAIGKNVDTAYRRRAKSVSFRRLWAEALSHGYARLEAVLLDRALNGRRTTRRDSDGKPVVEVKVSDQLGMQLLTLHRRTVAEHRAASGPAREDPKVTRARLAKLINALVAKMPDRPAADVVIEHAPQMSVQAAAEAPAPDDAR